MDNKEIKQKLRSSLDMAHVKITMLAYFFGLLFAAGIGALRGGTYLVVVVLTYLLVGMIMWLPALNILFRIYREPAGYRLYKATLSQPHAGFPRAYMYFTVVLEDPDGGKFLVNTNTIFQSYGHIGPTMEDYVNQTVTIAYNEDTGAVVVVE